MAVQRGVGVFESIRVYDGLPFALRRHIERLAESAAGAGIMAASVIEKLPAVIREGLARPENKSFDGLVKPYITGGDVNDGGRFPAPRFFAVFDEVHKLTEAERQSGIVLEPNRVSRPFPLIKSTNYLPAFVPLAKAPAGVFETLYITDDGEITEAMSSNFFICKEGRIITAPAGRVLAGVTREIVLALARESGYQVEERCPRESELAEADEAFVTGTVKELRSVVRVGARQIGNGRPGPTARELHRLFVENRGRWLEKSEK